MIRPRIAGLASSVIAIALGCIVIRPDVAEASGGVARDVGYFVDNTQMDLIDLVTAPLHVADSDSVLRSPRFYLVLAGVGAAWGGAFALDQTIRSHLRDMSSSDAALLEHVSYGSVSAATASLYGYGLWSGDARARENAMTAGEAAGVASLVNVGVKAAFGRLRPRQDGHDHTAFFRGGGSLFSGDVTPMFALAAGVSDYFENRWYVAAPIYSLALVDGFGRIGHDAHWFSDVAGAALLGAGTTELLLYLHERHAQEPDRWRFFPDSFAPISAQGNDGSTATGLAATWNW